MRELAVQETDDEYARLWRPDRDNSVLFVTHITDESATRYQFDLLGADGTECVYAKGDGITPPRVVIELLNETDYTVRNLPNISETDPGQSAFQLIDAIEWLAKHGGFEKGDLRTFAYQRAENVLTVVYSSQLLLEVAGSEEYGETLESVLENASQSGRLITPDELLDPRTHDIEFLQTVLVEMRRSLPMSQQEEVVRLAEERYGITADGDGASEQTQTWDSISSSQERIELSEEVNEHLVDEGWLPEEYR